MMRAFSFLILVSLSLVFALASEPGPSMVPNQAAAVSPKAKADSTPVRPDAARQATVPAPATPLSDRLAEAERRALILEARSEIEDAAYARLEVILAAFGALITVLVVGFGIATYRAAANAARAELADVKDRVEALQLEAEIATGKSLEAAKSADESAGSARDSAQRAQSHERSAQQDSAKVREAAALAERQVRSAGTDSPTQLSRAERATVADAAREVADKPERDWTGDDFRVRILAATDDGNCEEVLRLSQAMESLHRDDPESLAFALFNQALALRKLGQNEKAFETYKALSARLGDSQSAPARRLAAMGMTNLAINLGKLERHEEGLEIVADILKKFSPEDDPGLLVSIAKAMATKGFILGKMGRWDEGIQCLDSVLEKFGSVVDERVQEEVAYALVSKGFQMVASGKHSAAIAIYDQIIDRFGASANSDIQLRIRDAIYNKACAYSLMKKVSKSIEMLEKWREKEGGFDCEKVRKDTDFNSVRNRPEFIRYLRKQGCPVDSEPEPEALSAPPGG